MRDTLTETDITAIGDDDHMECGECFARVKLQWIWHESQEARAGIGRCRCGTILMASEGRPDLARQGLALMRDTLAQVEALAAIAATRAN